MKRMLVLLMALSLCALPALAGQGPDVGPLSVEELNAFTERLLVRGLADQLPVAASEEGFVATGEGYTLYLESSDLSLDSVLSDASITLESSEKEDFEDPRGITVLTPLDVLYASYPDNNPGVYGTREGAVLYLMGELPGAVAMGLVTRDGQDVTLVEHSLWQPVEDGYMHSGIQYSVDRGLVVGIHYFGGSVLKTLSETQEAIAAARNLLSAREYFAFDTVNPLPLQSEDLSFGELDFLDLTPEFAAQVLGQASYDERMKDSNGEELRVMQWDGVEAAFSYTSSGEFKRAERVDIVRGERRRRLHKAFLRWHDPANWPLLREALKAMGRADLIGNGKHHLIPTFQPVTDGSYQSARRKNSTPVGAKPSQRAQAVVKPGQPRAPKPGQILTQHTGLPPRETGGRSAGARPTGRKPGGTGR